MCKKLLHPALFSIFLVLLSAFPSLGQDFLWQEIPGFDDIEALEGGDNGEFFLLSEGGLFGIREKGIGKNSPKPIGYAEGLTGNQIANIHYSPSSATLLVYYHSGAFDLVSPQGILTNDALARNLSLQDKTLFRTLTAPKDKLYLCGAFGLSKVDIPSASIEATYLLMQPLHDVAQIGDLLFVLDAKGNILQGDESTNLQDPANWQQLHLKTLHIDTIDQIASLEGSLLLFEKKKKKVSLYDPKTKKITREMDEAQKIFVKNDHCFVQREDYIISLDIKEIDKTYLLPSKEYEIKDLLYLPQKELLYAYSSNHLLTLRNDKEPIIQTIRYKGPRNNRFFDAVLDKGSFYSVAGGRTFDRSWIVGSIAIKDKQDNWTNISRWDLPKEINRNWFFDLVSIAVDPKEKNHFFVGSWGEGLYEYRNNKCVKNYSLGNSPLESALPSSPNAHRYVRVSSLSFDAKGNLWLTQGNTNKNIWMKNREGKWFDFEFPEIAKVNAFDKLLHLPSGTKWLNMAHRGLSGVHALFVFNINKTADDKSDDKSLYITQFPDRKGKNIEAKRYYDMTLDRNGALWIGSDKGPLIITDPEAPIKKGKIPVATRPIGGVEPNLFYVLDNIPVTSIAVDGINNKWVGTLSDGLYLLSSEGTEIFAHFTHNNSPLISNNITSLLLDETTGLLYISTDKGLITYETGSNLFQASPTDKIHAYPNPLRPEDPDKITFTGLAPGMDIKIINEKGDLILSATSIGATYSFAPREESGKRLPAGIYTALFYDTKFKKDHSIQFAIIQ